MATRESGANNPVFKFNRDNYSVKIDSIPDYVSRQDVIDLFQNFIGEMRKCVERVEMDKSRSMELAFSSRDAYMKALCMNGYTLSGVALSVTPSTTPNSRLACFSKQSDVRRNLYVLGLPFDLTKSEFVDIFSRYGKVSHAVILATIDNASRRRGFVVMSSHAEAKLAMSALSRTEIQGHMIDVSWAVVQRSQGFLDGGDRTVASPVSPSSPTLQEAEAKPMESVSYSSRLTDAHCVVVSTVTSSLLISNLPTLLFSQTSDLQPLLFPFGQIIKLEILTLPSSNVVNVTVEYSTAESAYEAKMTLQGQVYANHTLDVEFIQSLSSDGGDLQLRQKNTTVPLCYYNQTPPSSLLGSSFAFNSQQQSRFADNYLSGGKVTLQRGIPANVQSHYPNTHSPYAYLHHSNSMSQPGHGTSWLNEENALTAPPSCQSIGSPTLSMFYHTRFA